MDLKRFMNKLCVVTIFMSSTLFAQSIQESSSSSYTSEITSSTAVGPITHTTETFTSLLEVPVGGDCSSNNCSLGAVCENTTCKLDLNASCINNTDECRSETECDNGYCKYIVGGNCGSNSSLCTSGTTCESSVCKYTVGGNCGSNSSLCVSGTTCESSVCKYIVGGNCGSNSSLCASGTTCENFYCKYTVGGNCGSNSSLCSSGTTCESSVCKYNVGGNCGSNSSLCSSGTTCESSYCKYTVGGNCGSNSSLCASGTTCESSYCKYTVGGNCGSNSSLCASGTTCESSYCRILAGYMCNGSFSDTQQCVANAVCTKVMGTEHRCICGDQFYNSSGVCKNRHTFGSPCIEVYECLSNLSCTVINATDKRCLCPDSQFSYEQVCYNGTDLQVSNLSRNGSYMEQELNLQWIPPDKGSNKSYDVLVVVNENITRQQTFEKPYAQFSGLEQGTLYTIKVFTTVDRNPGYGPDRLQNNKPVELKEYTRPAEPGELVNEILDCSNETVVNFTPSKGRVERYILEVEMSSGVQTYVANGTVQGYFYSLTAGVWYRVNITAQSGTINSTVRSSQFRCHPVQSQAVSMFSAVPLGSRRASFNWSQPTKPNGKITGYTLKIYDSAHNACLSGVVINCSDCSYNDSNKPNVIGCTKISYEESTKNDLENTTKVFQITVDGLPPYTNLCVEVIPYNELGDGKITLSNFTTLQEAADELRSFNVSASDFGHLHVTWDPGERRGLTNYFVTWAEETCLTCNTFNNTRSSNISGYESNFYTIPNLLSYWNYFITVNSSTSEGHSPNTLNCTFRTLASQPGLIQDLNISQPEDTAQYLDMTFKCPKERERNGIIREYVYNSSVTSGSSDGKTQPSGVIPVMDSQCFFTTKLNVSAETEYSINVFAQTDTHTGNMSAFNINVKPRAPHLNDKPFPGFGFAKPEDGKITQTTVPVKVCKCLLDPRQGSITMVGLIVCQKSDKENCQPRSGTQLIDTYKDTSLTWANFSIGNTKRYRPTPDNYLQTVDSRQRRSTVRSLLRRSTLEMEEPPNEVFLIGNNTICDKNKAEFCNGPLSPNTLLNIIVFACTHGGCSESLNAIQVTTLKEESVNVGAIVGGIFGALIAIALVVLIFFFIRRYQKKDDFVEIDAPHKTIVRKPVKLKHFAEHLERLHRDSNLLFQEEFEEVQENSPKNYSTDAATLDANKVKNRYVNILSFDHTRVKLITDDGDPSTDFINANYIPGYSSPREYIATQGPMVSTVADMWRMMWEQNSSIIVMLSDLTEKGRPKVDMYWPNELNSPVQYGNVIVDMTACSTLNTYTIRNFTISMENGNEKRRVTQYFFPGWEDYGANVSPEDLLDFVKAVRQEATSKPDHGPITVHCSAGVGRTGTFIALDFLMQFVNDNSLDAEVDIYNLVLNMRHHRPMMVQSEKQYIFVHDALKLIIENKIKAMKEQNEDNIYQNTTSDNIYANQAFEPEDENLYENTNKLGQPTTTL